VEDPDELIQMAAEALDLVSQDTYDERSNDMAL
jgi:predicted RNase H-like HicB family nuclease